MVNWILVLIVGLLIFFFFRWHYLRHKIITAIVIFFVLSFYFSVTKNISEDVNFASLSGVGNVIKTYFAWIGHTIKNLKSLTGGVTKIDWWTIENKTNVTKITQTLTKPPK